MARPDLVQLSQVPMFSACADRDLARIDKLVERVDVAAGEVVVREGETGHELYVIVAGTAEVSREGRLVADLEAGRWFGELSLLAGDPRDATVTMTSGGRLLVVAQRNLFALLDQVPSLARQLLVGMARRLHEADRRP